MLNPLNWVYPAMMLVAAVATDPVLMFLAGVLVTLAIVALF